MFPSYHQFSSQSTPLVLVESTKTTTLVQVYRNEVPLVAKDETQNQGLPQATSIIDNSEVNFGMKLSFQNDLRMLGMKIKQHEDSIRHLKTQKSKLDDSIQIQEMLGKNHPSSAPKIENKDHFHLQNEEETTKQIRQHEKSAAGIMCHLKTRYGTQAFNLTLTKNVLGAVATLGKVDDENLSRLFSEYLGVQTMLAIVCRTYEGVNALEIYNQDGYIDKTSGLHGLGASTGSSLDGRFLVICLESLRPYAGDFVADDPQRRLDLLKPRLPNGKCPSGFLGFAVNMIHLDSSNLLYVTASGDGLRETLFYNLFSRLQVYRTRAEMVLALPCISEGAVSLDGGMIRSPGVFSLGSQEEVDVRFPKPYATSDTLQSYNESEKHIKEMRWAKEKLEEDMKRELALLNHAMVKFERKKLDYVMFLAQSSSYTDQVQAARKKLRPRCGLQLESS